MSNFHSSCKTSCIAAASWPVKFLYSSCKFEKAANSCYNIRVRLRKITAGKLEIFLENLR
jgi:hypothetical protein